MIVNIDFTKTIGIQFSKSIFSTFLEACYTLGNFDLTEDGRLIGFTSIKKEILLDQCITRFRGHSHKDFVCTNVRAEENVSLNLN